MGKIREIETLSPGMGVGLWNKNPALKRVGSLGLRNENGVNIYELNGQPIAYGTRGPDNGYRITETKPGQQAGEDLQRGKAAGQDKIERNPGKMTRQRAPGTENVRPFPIDTRLRYEKPDPWWERVGQDIEAIADVPRTLAQQALGFPASKIGAAAASVEAARNYPARWLASKIAPSRVNAPENPLETGQKVEKGIYDFIAQPDRPRADLTTNAVQTINEVPPVRLGNLPFEWAHGLRNKLAEKGYPNAGWGAETLADLGLLWLMGRGGEETGLAERLVPEKPYRIGYTIEDVGERERKLGGQGKLAEGREAVPQSKPGGSAAEIVVGSNVPELNGLRFPDAVARLYDSALDPKDNSLKRISLGQVSAENVRRVKEAAAKEGVDIDLSGYTRDMDNYSIRHIHGEHGNPVTEGRRGQVAVTREDIARIPEIVETADEVSYEGQTGHGRDLIRYRKRIDGTVYYYEEIRTRRGRVNPTTLYKTKAGTSSAP
jgi:hypothetical protein